MDWRLARGQVAVSEAALDAAPRFANPAWYSGEALFGIISLLLPGARPTPREAVLARLRAIPDFLADGIARLAGGAAPRGISDRAGREVAAAASFLSDGLQLHADFDAAWEAPAAAAADAFIAFGKELAGLADAPPACGKRYLERLMRDAHGLDIDADTAVARAAAAFDGLTAELTERAARRDPSRRWTDQIADLSALHAGSPEAVMARLRGFDAEARRAAAGLVTPADDYGLEYRWLAPCFAAVAGPSYFLPYRSPPAHAAGAGSLYWVHRPGADLPAWLRGNCDVALKVIHAVHHGSIGHHSQNARARAAPSRLAQLAGTDCALGLAFLGAGTMVEGWACYAQDLVGEVPGFYSELEELYNLQQQRRNAASVLVDIRLHTGEWTPAEAAAFYRDEAQFAPARIDAEIVRNVMLPGTRLMYWLGVQAIHGLRRRWRGEVLAFHDTLIGHGHVPVAWAGDEMARAGQLA